jgi:hypothetical protein
MSVYRLPSTQYSTDLPQIFTKCALLCVWVHVKVWRSSNKFEGISGSAARGLQNWPFLELFFNGAGARKSCPILFNPSETLLCNVFESMWSFEEVLTSLRVFFFWRPETSGNGLFGRVFSAPFECCSSSSSSLRVPLALRARSDHVFTLLIKKCRCLHVLQILRARRGCPHSQSHLSQWRWCALDVALIEFFEFACSACTASTIWSCFHFIDKEMPMFARFADFESAQRVPPQCLQKRAIWHMLHTGTW